MPEMRWSIGKDGYGFDGGLISKIIYTIIVLDYEKVSCFNFDDDSYCLQCTDRGR